LYKKLGFTIVFLKNGIIIIGTYQINTMEIKMEVIYVKKNHENRKLDKQLIAYSLAAGTVFIGAVSAKANIHHTDLGSGIELYTDGAALDIDFDGGGTEFRIFFGTSSNRVNVDYRSGNASWRGRACGMAEEMILRGSIFVL